MHDLTVDRTTSGSGEVAKLSLEELHALDAGGEPPPTLADVLEITRGRALLTIEIKPHGIEGLIATVAREQDSLGEVMAWSFFPQALESIRAAEPRTPGALLLTAEALSRWPEARERALRLGLQGVSVFHSRVDEQLTRDCQRSGLALYAWTVDRQVDIARLIDLGIDGVCTNFPDRAVTLLDSKERA
jgi:glycerophosphoryl diester phosphodiesterase